MRPYKLAICACLLLLCAASALATEYVDRTDSCQSYGACVASAARTPTASGPLRRARSSPRIAVLLRTDGGAVDLDALGAQTCIAGPGNRFTLIFTSAEAAGNAVEALRGDPHVRYAEEDCEVTACDTAQVDDIGFNSYGAPGMDFAPLLTWARRCDRATGVAVIDSGVSAHELLAGRLEAGWDYVDGDDDPGNDSFGHGTHVAGIVADCTRGAQVTIFAYRVLNDSGRGSAANAANAILAAVERGVPIINVSFASTTPSDTLDDAVLTALEDGHTVVVSAGNNAADTAGVWPAHLTEDGVIVVGAASASGARASYSNYGESVDLYAYGTGVLSCASAGGYVKKSGTSQAAPHISAACALLDIVHGAMSPQALEGKLRSVLVGDIPMAGRLAPRRIEAHLAALTLGLGEARPLPTFALPASCSETIRWSTSDETVAAVEDGVLTAVGVGTTALTGRCENFDDMLATIEVTEAPSAGFTLPDGLTILSEGALEGTGAAWVIAGDALESIGDGAIGPDPVLLCAPGSFAADYAEANGLQYIAAGEP